MKRKSAGRTLPRTRIGCCGFPVARVRYWRELDAVEVQQTFYSPPRAGTAARWREEAPRGAEIILKCWQVVTHTEGSPTYRRMKGRMPEGEVGHLTVSKATLGAWEQMRELADASGARAILVQTPASFAPPAAPGRLRRFLAFVDRGGLEVAWEWRGKWEDREALDLCGELGLTPVVDPFVREIPSGRSVYLRIHGGQGNRHRFTDEELAELRDRLRGLRADLVRVLFNNLSMWDAARALRTRLG